MRGALWRPIQLRRLHAKRLLRQGSWTITAQPQIFNRPRIIPPVSRAYGRLTGSFESPYAGDDDILHHQRQELDAILKRAPHGIDSLVSLEFESDVGNSRLPGSKLSDLPVNRQDLDLWLVLLEYRLLKHGRHGVRDILSGMGFRGPPVKLLKYDDASDRIWELSLAAAVEDADTLYMLCDSKHGIGRDRPTLFLDLVTALLSAGKLVHAQNVAVLLRTSHFRGKQDLRALFNLVLDEATGVTLDDFCAIHHRLPFTGIYADIVPSLWQAKRSEDALKLHAYLLDHDDFPPKFENVEPLVRQLAHDNRPLQPLLSELEKSGLSFSSQARHFYAQVQAFQSGISVEAMDLTNPNKRGLRQRRLTDQFVARVLATHAFSFEFALTSLKFFGLVEIGPLAVRELGTSAKSIEEVKSRFDMLQRFDIDTGSSTFVTVVRNLCHGKSEVLLKAVLECDQHHEVFEDRETQRRLLSEYYHKKDWHQVNRTLAVLNRGNTGPAAQQSARKMLLKSAIVVRDWRGALTLLNAMSNQASRATKDLDPKSAHFSLDFMVDTVLAKGRQHNLSDQDYLDRVQFLAGLLQDMEFSGISVGPKYWRTVLFRLGELSCFAKLENLSLWLVSFYGNVSGSTHMASVNGTTRVDPCTTVKLFDASMLAAILQRSVCPSPIPDARDPPTTEKYRRGLRLVHTLSKYGVLLGREKVRDLYQSRLESLRLPASVVEHHLKVFDEAWELNINVTGISSNPSTGFRDPYFPQSSKGHQTLPESCEAPYQTQQATQSFTPWSTGNDNLQSSVRKNTKSKEIDL